MVLSKDEKTAFVTNYEEGLWIIDVSNRNKPIKIGSVPNWEGTAFDVRLSSDENTACYKSFKRFMSDRCE